jgi:putative transposase
MEAQVTGTSTRKVENLVAAMAAGSGISKSELSRACADLDIEVAAFRDRSLTHVAFPYVFADATFCKARTGGDRRGRGSRVTAQAVVIATGISADGQREVLGFEVGDSESGAFWTAFLRSLRARGLHGVQLVTSDAHTGLKAAIGSILLGAAWQRCRQHFARNLVAMVPRGQAGMVAAAVRTIFVQPDAAAVRAQLDVIADMLGSRFPKVEAMLRQARDEITAFADFPAEHWKKVWSTNGLARANKEIKRRTDFVGVFPNPPSLLRFAGIVLADIHDEWQVGDRRIFSEASMAKLRAPEVGDSKTGEQGAVATW